MGLGECAGKKGGQTTGPNPTDKGKAGWKRHFVADRGGLPLAVVLRALQTSVTRRSWKRPWMASSRSSGLLVGNPVGRARASEEAARRQSLRFPPLPQSLEEEEYNTTHRPPWDRLEREVGTAQVGGGAYAGLVEQVSQAFGALRAARRYPRGVSPTGLLAHLPQPLTVRV